MKHLRKFEELEYSTYMSAADKLDQFGQTKRASDLRDHALNMSRRFADEIEFGIMVGGVRPFPNAKFTSLEIFKAGDSWCLRGIFHSGTNTHRIDSNVSQVGDITWKEGNKFIDKRSVINFQKVIDSLSKIQGDFDLFFQMTGLRPEDLKISLRTFYS